MNAELEKLWRALKATNELVMSVKRDVDFLSNMRHEESTSSIEEAQIALAEIGGMLTGEEVAIEPEGEEEV